MANHALIFMNLKSFWNLCLGWQHDTVLTIKLLRNFMEKNVHESYLWQDSLLSDQHSFKTGNFYFFWLSKFAFFLYWQMSERSNDLNDIFLIFWKSQARLSICALYCYFEGKYVVPIEIWYNQQSIFVRYQNLIFVYNINVKDKHMKWMYDNGWNVL